MKQINLNTILLVAVAVLLTLQISSLFKGGGKMPDISGELKAKDEIIEMIKEEREQDRRMFDSTIALLKEMDNNKVKEYYKTIPVYEKIPVTVSNYSNDELRRAIWSY